MSLHARRRQAKGWLRPSRLRVDSGADAYEVFMDGYFLGGCVTDHGAVISGQVSTGRVQAVGLCLGSQYDVSIRARANGVWGPWSGSIHITL